MKKKLAAAALTAALAISGTALFAGTAQAIPAGCTITVPTKGDFWGSECKNDWHYSEARVYFYSGYSALKKTSRVAPGKLAYYGPIIQGYVMDGPWIHVK